MHGGMIKKSYNTHICTIDYVEKSLDAQRRIRKGDKQHQCAKCFKWFWSDEKHKCKKVVMP